MCEGSSQCTSMGITSAPSAVCVVCVCDADVAVDRTLDVPVLPCHPMVYVYL